MWHSNLTTLTLAQGNLRTCMFYLFSMPNQWLLWPLTHVTQIRELFILINTHAWLTLDGFNYLINISYLITVDHEWLSNDEILI